MFQTATIDHGHGRARVSDPDLEEIREKVLSHTRLDETDGIRLFGSHDLPGIGRLADLVRRRRHGDQAFYVYNQHLNFTNVCQNRCRFCAYARDQGDTGAFTLSLDEIRRRVGSRIHEPVTEIHIVGGLNPALGFDYYVGLVDTVKSVRPGVTVKAFTPVEIDHLSRITGESIAAVIATLKSAGLAMMPGGGAEVMSDRVRSRLFPRKIDAGRWLEIMAAVHAAGIPSNATMLYGHIETIEERVRHLVRLRSLQDRTNGFSAYIPLAFHSENTRLSHLPPTTGIDDLKNVAVARLMLDNFPHIKAYWVMIGEPTAQVALSFGADDLDGTIVEEKITHMAGATSPKGLTRSRLRRLIRAGGFTPVERDSFYQPAKDGPPC